MIIRSIFLSGTLYFNYLKIHITKKTTQDSLNKFIYNDEIRQIDENYNNKLGKKLTILEKSFSMNIYCIWLNFH